MADFDDQEVPMEEGFYWARTGSFQWYNLIVRLTGKAPVLFIYYAFDISKQEFYTRMDPDNVSGWGPKIEHPDPKRKEKTT